MEDVNRIKLVLVEKKERVNGWQSNWELILQLSVSGVQTHLNQISLA